MGARDNSLHPGEELPTEKESVLSKTEILPGGSNNRCSKRSGKTKEKRDGTIGLMGGFSLKTSAINGRIYFGVLYKKCQYHKKDMKGEEPWVIKQILMRL